MGPTGKNADKRKYQNDNQDRRHGHFHFSSTGGPFIWKLPISFFVPDYRNALIVLRAMGGYFACINGKPGEGDATKFSRLRFSDVFNGG
jgi:hypothetical protein